MPILASSSRRVASLAPELQAQPTAVRPLLTSLTSSMSTRPGWCLFKGCEQGENLFQMSEWSSCYVHTHASKWRVFTGEGVEAPAKQ
jgi:hypothetical protein